MLISNVGPVFEAFIRLDQRKPSRSPGLLKDDDVVEWRRFPSSRFRNVSSHV